MLFLTLVLNTQSGHLETVHAFTNDQNLIDNYHKKARRGRSAALNMVLTETGAAKAVAQSLPEMAGKLSGSAIRVPTPNVSMAVLILQLGVRRVLSSVASQRNLRGLGGVQEEVTKEDLNNFLFNEATYGRFYHQIGFSKSEVSAGAFVQWRGVAHPRDACAGCCLHRLRRRAKHGRHRCTRHNLQRQALQPVRVVRQRVRVCMPSDSAASANHGGRVPHVPPNAHHVLSAFVVKRMTIQTTNFPDHRTSQFHQSNSPQATTSNLCDPCGVCSEWIVSGCNCGKLKQRASLAQNARDAGVLDCSPHTTQLRCTCARFVKQTNTPTLAPKPAQSRAESRVAAEQFTRRSQSRSPSRSHRTGWRHPRQRRRRRSRPSWHPPQRGRRHHQQRRRRGRGRRRRA